MPDVWVPGLAGPHEDFVARVHRLITAFAREAGIQEAAVELELNDGARFRLGQILPEPGYGFITICPHPDPDDDEVPRQLIVPLASIDRIELYEAHDARGRLGFSVVAQPQEE